MDGNSYFVTKRSWKGKYKRVLTIKLDGISTLNPTTMEVTNQWLHEEIVIIYPTGKNSGNSGGANCNVPEFLLVFRKRNKKQDTMRFASEHRSAIISDVMQFRHLFSPPDVHSSFSCIENSKTWNAQLYSWSGEYTSILLRTGPAALEQLDPHTLKIQATYNYESMANIYMFENSGFVLREVEYGRLFLFFVELSENIKQIMFQMIKMASTHLAIDLPYPSTQEIFTLGRFESERYGSFCQGYGDIYLTSVTEFTVYRQQTGIDENNGGNIRCLFCLTETCIVERDPATYQIYDLWPLKSVLALVRPLNLPQTFLIELSSGCRSAFSGGVLRFKSTERDVLLASALDIVRASGNRDVHVRSKSLLAWKRLGPLYCDIDEEVEISHIRFLAQPPAAWNLVECVERFNANVTYSGLHHAVTQEHLFAENKDKLICNALNALVSNTFTTEDTNVVADKIENLEAEFLAIRRLAASKSGFAAFTNLIGFRSKIGLKVVHALKLNYECTNHAAIDTITALMQPMHQDFDLRQEALNKSSLLSSEEFLDNLIDMWTTHVIRGTGSLVVGAMLDFFTFVLCPPYSETTKSAQFDIMLSKIANNGRTLFALFQHPSLTIVKGAGLIMRALIEEGSVEIGTNMQRMALSQGALPIHLFTSLFTPKTADPHLLTHRQLSRILIEIWVTDNSESMELMARILPAGLLQFLNVPKEENSTVIPSEVDRLIIRDNLSIVTANNSKQRHALLTAAGKTVKTAMQTADKLAEKSLIAADEAIWIAERQLQHWRTRLMQQWNTAFSPDAAINGVEESVNDVTTTAGYPPYHKFSLKKEPERPIVLRKRRERTRSCVNWTMLFYQFGLDHTKPDLIWNCKTRQELSNRLESEISSFREARELSAGSVIAWNFSEFEIIYGSLADEIKIGHYFLRILLESKSNLCISQPKEFFSDLYSRFLLTPRVEIKCLTLQAMAIVYGAHGDDIRFFHDTKYIIAMLERSCDRTERDRLLLFLSKLISCQENAREIVRSNGIRILIDLLPLAHLHTSRATVQGQTAAIDTDGDNAGLHQEKEWYYARTADKERVGPVSFDEMRQLFEENTINGKTKVWAQGLDTWRLLQQVPQLKWSFLAKGTCILNGSELTSLILSILIDICQLFPSRDSEGAIIRPLPKIKAILSDVSNLPHIVQLLLTFDPILVEKVASLLLVILQDNPRLPQLYLSGCFYFILMYTGSNVMPVAKFLHHTHNRQNFRSHGDFPNQKSLRSRSILAQILPEAMVAYLENHGADKFAVSFLGEFDTPEIIWNSEMRRLMIQKIACHLADYTPRLRSNVLAPYQFCPIPTVIYPALETELFCDIYYLRNLCNIDKFKDWPITNPLSVLREILRSWKVEVEKKPTSLTLQDAYAVLGIIAPSNGGTMDESIVRKAYFKMAHKYHPDKNPSGREMFEKVNFCYEFLTDKSARMSDFPNPLHIVLILRAQSILFQRYGEILLPYKYSGYPLLIKTIQIETADDDLFAKSNNLLASSAECAYSTMLCSALNAEELCREDGIEVLYAAFERCVGVLSKLSTPEDVAVLVCDNITRCFTTASSFEICRQRMVEMPQLTKDVCRLFCLVDLPQLRIVAAECVSAMAVDPILQMNLLQAGVLWHLLIPLFYYDYTLTESGLETDANTNQQFVSNKLANLCLSALGQLSGYPRNDVYVQSLSSLIGSYLVNKLLQSQFEQVLKLLNSNSECPYLIWDNGTRAELMEYLEEQRDSCVRKGIVSDSSFGVDFVYNAHKNKLIIGDIFVSIYNDQPTFVLENPAKFAVDLLNYIRKETQYIYSLFLMKKTSENSALGGCEMALQALSNVIRNNGTDIAEKCVGNFCLLFYMLRLESYASIQEKSLRVISNVTDCQSCLQDIGVEVVANLSYMLLLCYVRVDLHMMILDILYVLVGDSKLLCGLYDIIGLLPLLDIFCHSTDNDVRLKVVEVLGKMVSNKSLGQKVKIFITKFLPDVYVDAMRTSPAETVIQMYETDQENPELVWNLSIRQCLSNYISELRRSHLNYLRADQNVLSSWVSNPQQDIKSCCITIPDQNLIVGGVYIKLFLKNPGWVLRQPRQFLNELLEYIVSHTESSDDLESVTMAVVCLLEVQPTLADIIPATGFIQCILQSLKEETFHRRGTLIIAELSRSLICIECMASHDDTIRPLMEVMKLRSDLSNVICETLYRLFDAGYDGLVNQAINCNLVSYFLNLLERPESLASIRAVVVKALKAMASSSLYGNQISQTLKSSQVWSRYEAQLHDLFISDRVMHSGSGYLTSTTPGVAGYLTASTTTKSGTAQLVPPPMPLDQDGDTHTNIQF